ncbi:hypothetical protein [Aquimarina sp. I32.4]|uniref:hypothetical protein n=1 Tax=Aquimarina sp. I32.4 TaxID=2053903 RepID=UPI0011AF46CC|nr:hypothetical protein [Aquimarina sp. I32.4]
MKIHRILLLLLLMNVSISVIGQDKRKEEFEGFKKFLPYIIKGFQEESISSKQINEETSGVFNKPWEVKKLQEAEVNTIIDKLATNKRFKIKKDYTGEWKLDFFSKLKNYESIEEIHKSNNRLSNVFIQISEIQIQDDKSVSVYIDDKNKNIKNNESKDLEFSSGQIHTTFPIKEEYSNLNGNITITLKGYASVAYKEFQKEDKDITFDLGNNKGIKLLKINKNIAYFVLPTKIDDVDIISTNKKNEKFSSHSKSMIPEKVYDFAKKDNLTEASIQSFIDTLSQEDVYQKSQLLKYETNGNIESLYIFIKSNEVDLGAKKLKIEM